MKKKLLEILAALGFATRVQNKETLSQTEWDQVKAAYKEKYGTELSDDLNSPDDEEESTAPVGMTEEQVNRVFAILGTPESSEHTPSALEASVQHLVDENRTLSQRVSALEQQPAEDHPAETVAVIVGLNGPGNTPQFLFGIDNPAFSMSHRWNRIAANPREASADYDSDAVESSFYAEARTFASSLARRYRFLHENHMLDHKRLASGEFSTTYQGVTDAKVGDQYVIRRQDALIARVLESRDMTQFFPVRYGIQDHDLVFNAFFTEVSQAWQPGEVFKGSMAIENEMGHVDDAMMKLKWGPMKEIERMYIGYLNKEGSDPIKWSMIEFMLLNSLLTAQSEQNKRRVRGIYAKPETGKATSYLNSSTGILYTLIRYVHEFKIKLHDDSSYNSYTSSTMLAAVREFVCDVKASLGEDEDLSRHVIYLNARHKQWWMDNCRTAYGKDMDFTGPGSYLNIVPDTEVSIRWLPYLGSLPLMFMDIPGNLQFLENVPGEMMNIKAKDDMELVKAWSVWKEGCAAAFTGRHFSTKAAMDANDYEMQQIFMNKPAVSLLADAVKADAKNGFWFLTAANTAPGVGEDVPVITDIENAKAGAAYIIECGSTTNASKIAKSGKFAGLTAAWTPTAVGDYIMVILNADGDGFRELERQVGGTRSVNKLLQPNIPGVR